MKSAELLNEFVAPHYAWIEQNFSQVWSRLDFPEWEEYSQAFHTCGSDLMHASQSTGKFFYLTFRPMFQLLFIVFRSLFTVLLEQGWMSLQKGAMQAKAGIIWFYLLQRELTRKEILGEIGIVSFCVAGYYLRKWIKRQTYWARATRWVASKKKVMMKVSMGVVSLLELMKFGCFECFLTAALSHILSSFSPYSVPHQQSYTEAVHRLAKVSLALAMTLPHLAFLGSIIALKLLLPSVVSWLASDTYTTAALSVWYPFISTLVWIHGRRNCDDTSDSATVNSKSNVNDLTTTYEKASVKSKQTAKSKNAGGSKVSNKKIGKRVSSSPQTQVAEASTTFWLRYWGTYAIVQAFSRFCHMVPVFGRFVARHPLFISLSAELKLVFFVWVFAMEALLGATTKDAFLAESLPLRLTTRHLNPIVLDIVSVVSEAISKERWKSLVHGKAQRVLDVFVMVRFLSENNRDWLLHVLDESRVLLIPSVTLFMPSFVTQFGVAYVQYLVPAAKSARAQGEAAQILYLQYWTLHCMFFGVLTWLSTLLWWIPFSTHVVFVAWCNLSFPKTITGYYAVLEMELVAFGILSGDATVAVHETKTAMLVSAITKRLPSATEDNLESSLDTPTKDSAAIANSRSTTQRTRQHDLERTNWADDGSVTSAPMKVGGAIKASTTVDSEESVQSLVSTTENDENIKKEETNENSAKSGINFSSRKAFQALDEHSLSSSTSSTNNIENESNNSTNPSKPMIELRPGRTRSQTTL